MVQAFRARQDPEAIAAAVRLFVSPGRVTEVRALNAVTASDRWPATYSGYFNDYQKLADSVCMIRSASGVYFILNPVDPALLHRAYNRIRKAGKGESTQDNNIVRRHWLLIDADAQRPAGISATDAEHDLAIEKARTVIKYLTAEPWPQPIEADSGNGAHVLYRIDLPVDDGGLVQRCLSALAKRFDDESVKVDQTVFNPARICKLYGTLACKGDNTPERPHRMSRIVTVLAQIELVPVALLEKLAAEATGDQRKTRPARSSHRASFDVQGFIDRNSLDAEVPEPWNGKQGPGKRWVLSTDPVDGVHNDDSCYIVEHASGAISAGCHHNSAVWTWDDLRRKYEPDSRPRPGTQSLDLPKVILPGGNTRVSEAASQLGELLAATGRFFVRCESVVTLDHDDKGEPILRAVKPAALPGVFETVARVFKLTHSGGKPQITPTTCKEGTAKNGTAVCNSCPVACLRFSERLP